MTRWTVDLNIAAAAMLQGMHVVLSTQPERTVIDKETGKEFVLAVAPHDLFFVPVKYWPWLLMGLGVLFFHQ